MKKNMGTIDRSIRLLVAILIAILYFTHILTGTIGIILLVFGIIMAITSLIGFCPLYGPLGINTCKKK